MRLKWDNFGKGLSDIASAYETNKMRKMQKEAIDNAKADAAKTGKAFIDQQQYGEATGFSDPMSEQARTLAAADAEFGVEGIKRTQAGLDSVPGWNPQAGDRIQSREAGAASAADMNTRASEYLKANPNTTTHTQLSERLQAQDALKPVAAVVAEEPAPGASNWHVTNQNVDARKAFNDADARTVTPGLVNAETQALPPLAREDTGTRGLNREPVVPGVLDDPTVLNSQTKTPAKWAGLVDTTKPSPAPPATPAPPQRRSAEDVAIVDRPKQDWQEIYHKRYVPDIVGKMIENGKLEEAQAFEAWSDSQHGKAYGKSWTRAVMAAQTGDTHGAMMAMQELYNKQLPDGQYAVVVPQKGKDGEYAIQLYDEKSHRPVGSQQGTAPDLLAMGLGMMAPSQQFTYLSGLQTQAATRDLKREEMQFDRETQMEVERAKAGNKPPPDRVAVVSGKPIYQEYEPGVGWKNTTTEARDTGMELARLALSQQNAGLAAQNAGLAAQKAVADNQKEAANELVRRRMSTSTVEKDRRTGMVIYTDPKTKERFTVLDQAGVLTVVPFLQQGITGLQAPSFSK